MGLSILHKSGFKNLYLITCLLGTLSFAAPVLAQEISRPVTQSHDTAKALSQFTLDRWGIEDGLPSKAVMAQVKAKSGYIWLATYEGLSRFDGNRFKNYNQRTHPQFPTNSLFDLLEDKKGTLWIATNGGGVLKMEGDEFSLIPSNEYLPNKSITSLAEDQQGHVWVGTRGGLALIRDNNYVNFPEYERLKNLHIFKIYTDTKGSLWIGTVGDGLWELNNGYLRQYDAHHGMNDQSIRSLYEDARGRLWIGTEEGLNLMEDGQVRKVPILNNSFSAFINDILQDELGTLWFATNEGLLRYISGKFELLHTDSEEGESEIQKLLYDGEGSLWIGTYYSGYQRIRDGKFKNFSRPEGLPNEVVNVVLPEGKGVWVGTNGGLAYLQQGVERVHLLGNSASSNRIRDIFRDSKGVLWVATYEGLFQQTQKGFERALHKGAGLASDKIRKVIEDPAGRLWIGTRNGLFVKNPDQLNGVSVVDELSGIFILSLFIDSGGNLWVATNGKGLFHFDGKRFRNFTTKDGLSSDVVFDIWEDKDQNIWVGSNDGLNILSKGSWHYLNERKGFFANTIFQILPDGIGNLWITTSKGIFLVEQGDLLRVIQGKDKQLQAFKQYTTADGMRSSEITAVSFSRVAADGTLWFTTLNGVSAIHPAKLTTNHSAPLVKLEKITGDKLEYSLTDPVKFAAGTKQYEFHYTGFNYYAPKATTFAYMLEGFDTEWQEAGHRRVAYYTNLPAGEYTFKIRAANEDGVWSKNEFTTQIEQEAHYIETAWFKGVVATLLLGLMIMMYFWRTKELKQKNQQLEQMVEERTNHINNQKESIEHQKEALSGLNQLKDRLLSVLSHDLRQPFSSISGLLALLREKQIDQQEFQHFTKELNQQVKWQVHMLDNVLLWTKNQLKGLEVKPVLLNLYQLVEEITILHCSQAGFKNITLLNEVATDAGVVADPDILHLVLRNLVGNALKFTPEHGTVTITSSLGSNAYRIEVTDNGVGIEKEKLDKLLKIQEYSSQRGTKNEKGAGLGLSICKEFIEAGGGKILAESKVGVGSRFIVELPFSSLHVAHTPEEKAAPVAPASKKKIPL